jgi:Protein of unknown function (DUF2505)
MTTHTHTYDEAPDALLAALADASYLAARHERFGGVGDAPVAEETDSEVVITTVRQLPMDKIPAAVKGLVGDGQITQVDTWARQPDESGSIRGAWRADLGTAPAVIGGAYTIEPDAEGSSYSCSVEVKVKVPFIGGKIEEQVRGYLDHLISKEQAFLADWLNQR